MAFEIFCKHNISKTDKEENVKHYVVSNDLNNTFFKQTFIKAVRFAAFVIQ